MQYMYASRYTCVSLILKKKKKKNTPQRDENITKLNVLFHQQRISVRIILLDLYFAICVQTLNCEVLINTYKFIKLYNMCDHTSSMIKF